MANYSSTTLYRETTLEFDKALDSTHEFFAEAYYGGEPDDFCDMDVKFDDDWGGDGV